MALEPASASSGGTPIEWLMVSVLITYSLAFRPQSVVFGRFGLYRP